MNYYKSNIMKRLLEFAAIFPCYVATMFAQFSESDQEARISLSELESGTL